MARITVAPLSKRSDRHGLRRAPSASARADWARCHVWPVTVNCQVNLADEVGLSRFYPVMVIAQELELLKRARLRMSKSLRLCPLGSRCCSFRATRAWLCKRLGWSYCWLMTCTSRRLNHERTFSDGDRVSEWE